MKKLAKHRKNIYFVPHSPFSPLDYWLESSQSVRKVNSCSPWCLWTVIPLRQKSVTCMTPLPCCSVFSLIEYERSHFGKPLKATGPHSWKEDRLTSIVFGISTPLFNSVPSHFCNWGAFSFSHFTVLSSAQLSTKSIPGLKWIPVNLSLYSSPEIILALWHLPLPSVLPRWDPSPNH